MAIVYTNIDININDCGQLPLINSIVPWKTWYEEIKSIQLKEISLDTDNVLPCSGKFYMFNDDDNIVQIIKRQAELFEEKIGEITEEEIKEALKFIVYAVRQPSDYQLTEIIKNDLKKYYEDYVHYCLKYVNQPDKSSRPYFLFTSRNQNCIPDITKINLDALNKEDAEILLKTELKKIKNIHLNESDVAKLAKVLQNFPLALQQAIAYIRSKNTKSLDGNYSVKNYLIEFENKKKSELLEYPPPFDFGAYKQVTLTTFDITISEIQNDQKNGLNAIKILQFLAYLYADEINADMFLSYFKNNVKVRDETLYLLENYSMITITKINAMSSIKIHRLVQTVFQHKFKKATRNNRKNN
uniref:CSON012540 protein n=1 Tax=Culicoides sonorensis TaxID=179676 RepID=A0A336LHI3_CULSO